MNLYSENPRKIRERFAKGPGPFIKAQPLILVYFFQLYTASKLDDFQTHRFSIQTQTYSNHFPRESLAKDDDARIRSRKQKWWSRKYRRKVLRKRYMSIMKRSLGSQHCSFCFFLQKSIADSVYRHQIWLADRNKMLGSKRIRITGRKFSLFFWVRKKRASPGFSCRFPVFKYVFREDSEPKDVFTKVFPRFMAIAERLWGGWAVFRSDAVRDGKLG